MTTNPFSANRLGRPFSSSNTPNRRPSYATVAAGAAPNLDPARFNTLAAAATITPTTTSPPHTTSITMSDPQRHPHPTRQRSRSSLRSMEIDGHGGSGAWKRPGSGWSSDIGRLDGRMGCLIHEEHPPFVFPSYLANSRHVQRLHEKYDKHVSELREARNNAASNAPRAPSLSASSSSVNLSKMHGASSHAHRAVVQDVVERISPPTEEDLSHPLPSRLREEGNRAGLEILADGTEMRFVGQTKGQDEAVSVRADHHMPKECGLYYYEITVLSKQKDAMIGMGFSGRGVNLNRLPGWEADSWAYHGDDGFSFASTPSGKSYGPKFASQDVVGCGVNFRTGNAFFTRNGVYLGVAFSGIKGDRLYPSVGMKRSGDHIRVNFGRDAFVFDINGMMDGERKAVMENVALVDIQRLKPPNDKSIVINELIGQYLAHEGYIETARAFAHDVNNEVKAQSRSPRHFKFPTAEDDVHAANRQKIRRAILDGDIDKALKFTNCFYPHVLADERNKEIHFRLRCRKFIEMMRQYAELCADPAASVNSLAKSAESLSSNGHGEGGIGIDTEVTDNGENEARDDTTDTQMELDNQLHREASRGQATGAAIDDMDMDASQDDEQPSKATLMRQNELLAQALAYGQELQSAFGDDPRQHIKRQLSDIFAIMAYTNPTESVVGGLLDPKGRVQIAEDVNGAILVSLGKPPAAALEKLVAQTEALLAETAPRTGGDEAFINVREDFLRP